MPDHNIWWEIKTHANMSFSVQVRAFDAAKSGAKLGVAAHIALCSALLKKSIKGGIIIVGELNLGGSIETVHNPSALLRSPSRKGFKLLLPVSTASNS